jgi:hypothetical protein
MDRHECPRTLFPEHRVAGHLHAMTHVGLTAENGEYHDDAMYYDETCDSKQVWSDHVGWCWFAGSEHRPEVRKRMVAACHGTLTAESLEWGAFRDRLSEEQAERFRQTWEQQRVDLLTLEDLKLIHDVFAQGSSGGRRLGQRRVAFRGGGVVESPSRP